MKNTNKNKNKPAKDSLANSLISIYLQAHFKNNETFYGEKQVNEGDMRGDCLKIYLATQFESEDNFKIISYFSTEGKQKLEILHTDDIPEDDHDYEVDCFISKIIHNYLSRHKLEDLDDSISDTIKENIDNFENKFYSSGYVQAQRKSGGGTGIDLNKSDKKRINYILHKALFAGGEPFNPRLISRYSDIISHPMNDYSYIIDGYEVIAVALKD